MLKYVYAHGCSLCARACCLTLPGWSRTSRSPARVPDACCGVSCVCCCVCRHPGVLGWLHEHRDGADRGVCERGVHSQVRRLLHPRQQRYVGGAGQRGSRGERECVDPPALTRSRPLLRTFHAQFCTSAHRRNAGVAGSTGWASAARPVPGVQPADPHDGREQTSPVSPQSNPTHNSCNTYVLQTRVCTPRLERTHNTKLTQWEVRRPAALRLARAARDRVRKQVQEVLAQRARKWHRQRCRRWRPELSSPADCHIEQHASRNTAHTHS